MCRWAHSTTRVTLRPTPHPPIAPPLLEQTLALRECMLKHEDYYRPMLEEEEEMLKEHEEAEAAAAQAAQSAGEQQAAAVAPAPPAETGAQQLAMGAAKQ